MIRSLPAKDDFVLLRSYNDSALVQILEIDGTKEHHYKVQIICSSDKTLMGEVKWTAELRPKPNTVASSWYILSLEKAEAYIARYYG